MASQWLKARQTKYAAYAATYILVVLAIVVVANVLADRYNKSYDTTSNKRYSLSDQTAKIVKGLKQDATITYFNQSTRFQRGQRPARPVCQPFAQGARRVCRSGQESASWRAQLASATSAPPWCRSATRKKKRRA